MISPGLVHGLANGLARVEQNPINDILLKEVLGLNFPKSLMTRNRDEMLDVASDQFGGTLTYVGSGFGTDWLLNRYFKPLLEKAMNPGAAAKWRELGQSFALFSIQAALYWCVPFIRNYLTARRTGSEDFTQLIGAHQRTGKQSAEARARLEQETRLYRNRALQILGTGLAGFLTAVAVSSMAIKRGWGLGKVAQSLHKTWSLKNGSFRNYSDLAAFVFVFGASYGGRLHAIRDRFEIKEQLLHFVNAVTWFFMPKLVFEKLFLKRFRNVVGPQTMDLLLKRGTPDEVKSVMISRIREVLKDQPEKLMAAEKIFVAKTGLSLAISIGLLSVMPALLNFYLTGQRIKRAEGTSSQITGVSALPPVALNDYLAAVAQRQAHSLYTRQSSATNPA